MSACPPPTPHPMAGPIFQSMLGPVQDMFGFRYSKWEMTERRKCPFQGQVPGNNPPRNLNTGLRSLTLCLKDSSFTGQYPCSNPGLWGPFLGARSWIHQVWEEAEIDRHTETDIQ